MVSARKKYAITVLLLCSLFFSGCANAPALADDALEPDTEHDFSIFLTGIGDPIRLNSLIEEYERNTKLTIEVITADSGSGSDRALWRRLNSQNPPALFTVDADTDIERLAAAGIVEPENGRGTNEAQGIEEIVSAIPLRLETKGLTADKELLAQLIAVDDPSKFIGDLKTADYREWSEFIGLLGSYITAGTVSDFKLNSRDYHFAAEKGSLVKELTGVFATSGANLSFLGREMLDRTLATTDSAQWTKTAGILAAETAAAEAAASEGAIEADAETETSEAAISEADILTNKVFGAYIAALAEMTNDIAGMYAPGIRGDDFVEEEYYSKEKANRIFTSGRAVFTDVTSEDAQLLKDTDSAQERSLVLLPVKIPYLEYELNPDIGGAAANKAVPVRVTKMLCINKSLSAEAQKQAQDFADWFAAAEKYDGNTLMQEAADYFKRGDTLPYSDLNEDYENQMTRFSGTIAEADGLPLYLADQIWDEQKTDEIRNYLKSAWSKSVDE